MMSPGTRRTAGFILILYPVIVLGGLAILVLFHAKGISITDPAVQSRLYGASYTQAAVLLILSLVMLRYVDDALLNDAAKKFVRLSIPTAAILGALGMLFSHATTPGDGPTGLIFFTYLAGLALIAGCVILAVGLIRR